MSIHATTDTATTAVARYFDAWNASGEELEEAVAAAFARSGSYTDPLADAHGRDAIVATIRGIHQQFPQHRFVPLGEAEGHHQLVRFSWELVAPDGTAPIAGSDVAVLDDAGRMSAVAGFLDRVPQG